MMVVAWPVTVVTRVLSSGVELVLEEDDVEVEGEDELDEDYKRSALHKRAANSRCPSGISGK